MKRKDLIQQLEASGCVLIRHGGKHEWYHNPATRVSQPVPRHTEINEHHAKRILKIEQSLKQRGQDHFWKSETRSGRAPTCPAARALSPELHVLNRRIACLLLFEKPADDMAFEKIVAETVASPVSGCGLLLDA